MAPVVGSQEWFADSENIYMITDMCWGGELEEVIQDAKDRGSCNSALVASSGGKTSSL